MKVTGAAITLRTMPPMTSPTKRLSGCALTILATLVVLLLVVQPTRAFQYQKDTMEGCSQKTYECTTSDIIWFQCPVTCSESLELEGSIAEISDDPEAFYELTTTRADGRSLSLEDYEGYVTVYAMVPLMHGMAQFYLEMLEHIAGVFPFTVQIILRPYWQEDSTADATPISEFLQARPGSKSRVVVLEAVARPTPDLKYLATAEIVAGNSDATLQMDRVTIFLVSADGVFIERLVSPTISLLERRISVYLQQLSMSPEL